MRRFALAMLALLLCAAPGRAAYAQAPARDPFTHGTAADGRIPILIVLSTSGMPPAFMRRTSADAPNVVVLDASTASEAQLSTVVYGLLLAEARDPGGAERSDYGVARVRPDADIPVFPWTVEALRRLRRAPRQQVRGVGAGATLQVWLPPVHFVSR